MQWAAQHGVGMHSEAMPAFVDLMCPALAAKAFSNADWLFEPKLSGQRSLKHMLCMNLLN